MIQSTNQISFGDALAGALPMDERNPLVLPPLRHRDPSRRGEGQPAAAEFSGSVSTPAGSPFELVLAPTPPRAPGQTFAGVPVAAVEAVMVERTRGILEHGHTAEKDLALRPSVLPDRAIRYLINAKEDLQFRRGDYRERAKHHLAQAGALVLAAWDYVDAGGGQ